MPYVNVWVDEDEFDLDDYDTDDLIEELEKRGHRVLKSPEGLSDILSGLYSDYMTLSKESFEKKLKKFFNETLDVYVR